MTKIQRGTASFESGGTVYHLVMDFNALAEAEEAADMSVDDLLRAVTPEVDAEGRVIRTPRVKHLGALLYGALRAEHPTITPAQANNLLGEGEQVGAAIAQALEGAMPKTTPSAVGKAPAKKRGTGTRR